MNRQGFTFIELMIVVFVIGILAAVGISKYQSFVIESRQKACMSQQKALDQAYAVWETKNTPVPADDGAYQFIHPLTGGPLNGETHSSYRFRWDSTADAFVAALDGDQPETKAVLPSGSQLARLVADEKLFACTEMVKRAGGAEFLPIPALTGIAADNVAAMANNAPVFYQFYKAPTVASTTAGTPGGDWMIAGGPSNLHNNYVPDKVRRAIICRGFGKHNSGNVGAAFTITTTAVPAETIALLNGAGPDGTRDTLHQSWLLQ